MGQLVAIRKLNVMENELHQLPGEFKNLKKLEELDLRNNPLCSDKLGAGEWKKLIPHLSALKQLRTGNTQPSVCLLTSALPLLTLSLRNRPSDYRRHRLVPILTSPSHPHVPDALSLC